MNDASELKSDKLEQNSSWCPVPWADISTNNTGFYRVCVQANSHRETRGILKDENNESVSLTTHPSSQARNSSLLKEIRSCMLRGEKHPVCERCNYEDASGLESRRKLRRKEAETQILFEKTKSLTKSDGSILSEDFPIENLDLRFGNLCNLSCRSCYPGESSGWFDEWHANFGPTFPVQGSRFYLSKNKNGKSYSSNKKLKWYEDEAFISNLEDSQLRHIHISGGEPLLIKQHLLFLKRLIERDEAKKITIDYNTNLTVLPDGILNVWREFKKVNLGVSIDGPEDANTFIRHPSKWDVLQKNLQSLTGQKHIHWWPTFTVMSYNVCYIAEFLKWKLTHFPNFESGNPKRILFVVHMLQNPSELRASVFPPKAKIEIEKELREFGHTWLKDKLIEGLGPGHQSQQVLDYYFRTLEGILGFMNGTDESHRHQRFLERNQLMDNFRGQNVSTALPKFWQLLNTK